MSRSWTKEELQIVSDWMKEHGHMSYDEFCQYLADLETKRIYYNQYLEKLRRSGVINMFGAVPYLMEEFDLDKQEATNVLKDWMENYNPDDYVDLV